MYSVCKANPLASSEAINLATSGAAPGLRFAYSGANCSVTYLLTSNVLTSSSSPPSFAAFAKVVLNDRIASTVERCAARTCNALTRELISSLTCWRLVSRKELSWFCVRSCSAVSANCEAPCQSSKAVMKTGIRVSRPAPISIFCRIFMG